MSYILLILPLAVVCQQFSTQRANVESMPAWYQGHPKMASNYGYDRVERPSPMSMNYQNYPSYGATRTAYPELTMSGTAPNRRYPVGGQDRPTQTSLTRYHQLLLKKQEQMRREQQRKETMETRSVLPQSLKSIYSTIRPTLRNHTSPFQGNSNRWMPLTPRETAKPESKPSQTSTTTVESTTQRTVASTTADRTDCCTNATSSSSSNFSFLEYLWPNAELLAAIKDVVAKFKASLDESGLDQDVKLMGNQLRNTWQQLRSGPMNEQLGRILEKAADDANIRGTNMRRP
ncbi:unnamed protein product [Cylicocyclus nassatus]|uniref:Uncharacterized protein n=1 Tax=Cylicocyclus nassatus TaxID=53992 RepID=A0AA36DPM0_CYLNA|nr:unnamed protein product [Cylicocyclus nassatus]